jgi:hypothetical protein
MNLRVIRLWAAAAAVTLLSTGCASYTGGSAYDVPPENGVRVGPVDHPSVPDNEWRNPSVRPGQHPNDIHDPASITWPRPAPHMN